MTALRLLFVTWDGPQVSYLESLYMPVLARLAERGHVAHVLQFTWADAARRASIRDVCAAGGATYRSVSVLRRPVSLGSLATALLGSRHVAREIARHSIDVVMPRSTLPAVSAMLAMRRLPRVGMLLDADGLPHDERVDFEGWSPQGLPYRLLRDLEASAVRRADFVLTRSRRACDILHARAGAGTPSDKFAVVGNGRDPALFAPLTPSQRSDVRHELGVADPAPLLVYAGSVGEQYCMPEMLEFFLRVRRRRADARLLLLTGSPDAATRYLDGMGGLRDACIVRSVAPSAVPRMLAAADLGLALRRQAFSMQAVAPIKLGEYLLCGLPVLATRGIGDSESLLAPTVGRLLDSMGANELDAAAGWFVEEVLPHAASMGESCRAWGVANFDMAATVDAYEGAINRAGRAAG